MSVGFERGFVLIAACFIFLVVLFFSQGHTTEFLGRKISPTQAESFSLPQTEFFDSGSLQLVGDGGDEKIALSLHGTTLKILINSTRKRCGIDATGPSEACVFRAYAASDSFRSGDYCSAIRLSNGSYQCNLRVIENHFKIFVQLESFANNSNFGLLDNPGWGALIFNNTHHSVGKALLDQEVQIGSQRILVPLVKHPKSCSYKEADVTGNDFIWVSKSMVEAAGLTGADAIVAPGRQDREFPLSQNYVWFPRGCHQPWVSQEALEAAGTAAGGVDLLFVGTSRIGASYEAIRTTYNFSSAVQLYHSYVKMWSSHRVWFNMAAVILKAPWPKVCATESPRLLVLVVSEGIWSVKGHEKFGPLKELGIFRHYDNFLVMLDIIRETCRLRRVKIVLATQPQIHSWDCRMNQNNTFLPMAARLSMLGPRMQVVNWAIRKVAREQGLLLADLGGASDARKDASCDNIHYDHQNTSLGVSVTFGQLLLAAVLEAITT